MRMMVGFLVSACLMSASSLAAAPRTVAAPVPVQAGLEHATAFFAKEVGGTIGFVARHLESGEEIEVNGDERFPMASTIKVAIATMVLQRVDRGEVRLDQMLTVEPLFIEQTGPVAQSVPHPGTALSVANLLELMLTQSNNTATDMMIRLADGPAKATAWLRGIGITGQRIDNDVQDLLRKFYGTSRDKPFLIAFAEKAAADPKFMEKAYAANPAFDADPEDTSTPRAMNALLVKIYAGELMSAESTAFLKGVMERCETGAQRLKGLLPTGTVVAHKTGTLGGTDNDVGVITLPQGRGHVAISVYSKGSSQPIEARDKAIAQVARTVYDYFALTAAGSEAGRK